MCFSSKNCIKQIHAAGQVVLWYVPFLYVISGKRSFTSHMNEVCIVFICTNKCVCVFFMCVNTIFSHLLFLSFQLPNAIPKQFPSSQPWNTASQSYLSNSWIQKHLLTKIWLFHNQLEMLLKYRISEYLKSSVSSLHNHTAIQAVSEAYK